MARSRLLAVVVLLGVFWASSNLEAQSKKGLDALGAGDYEQAIDIFKAAAQGGPEKDRFINFYFLGSAYYQNKQLPEAIAAFEESLKHRESAREFYAFFFTVSCYGELGQAYLDNKQYQEAASSFLDAANLSLQISRMKSSLTNPDPAAHLRTAGLYFGLLGRTHLLNKSYQEAVSAYNKAMELDPMNGLHYSSLALVYVDLKQYDDALAAARRGVELAANSQASYANLGDVHAARKEYDQAIDAYRKAVEVAPRQLEADQENQEKATGKSLSQKVYDQTREALIMASAGFYVKSSQMSVAKGDYDGAVEAINKAAELTLNNPDLYYQLGTIHARAGKFDEAIASLDKAIGLAAPVRIGVEIGIENGQPFLQRLIEGPAKEAGLEVGDRLIMIDGQSTKGWDIDKTSQGLRGEENTQVVLKIQRQGEARPFERTIIRKLIVPKSAAPYYGFRSLCAREKGNREGAAKDAGLAYSFDPENIEAREALAAVSLDGGKYETAIQLLSSVKDSPFARILEATAYAKQNDLNRAIAVYLAIPEDELAATALRRNAKKELEQTLQGHVQARLDKARASESAGRFLEALAEYAEAVKIVDETTAGSIRQKVASLLKDNPYLAELPEEARRYALRGDVRIKEGRFTDALAEYRMALKIAPFNAQLHFNTALIRGQLDDYRGAIKSMNVYLELSPDAPNARAAKDEIYKWEFALEKEGKK